MFVKICLLKHAFQGLYIFFSSLRGLNKRKDIEFFTPFRFILADVLKRGMSFRIIDILKDT